jgi:hypothetical protein
MRPTAMPSANRSESLSEVTPGSSDTGKETLEKPLVGETPDTPEDPKDTIIPTVTPNTISTPISTPDPTPNPTPDLNANMPSGMANVQQLRDGTFVVRAKWYHYARAFILR